MRVGILVPSIGNFGDAKFYNSQENGLALALSRTKKYEEIVIYKAVTKQTKMKDYSLNDVVKVVLLPVRNIGANGLIDVTALDKTLQGLICFSDNQLCIPTVAHWCKRNGVLFIPYIGVIESHSTGFVKRRVMDLLCNRNLRIYKQSMNFVKTPYVKAKLLSRGVGERKLKVMPVGLDLNHMKKQWDRDAAEEFRLLFVGRLEPEKRPLEMLEIYEAVCKRVGSERKILLLMVGKGVLQPEVLSAIDRMEDSLKQNIHYTEQIPNADMWELYCKSDVFVNLNCVEIFGMSLLEAMYYECPIVAQHAPGPNFIFENGKYASLCENVEEIVVELCRMISDGADLEKTQQAKAHLLECFTWDASVQEILPLLCGE